MPTERADKSWNLNVKKTKFLLSDSGPFTDPFNIIEPSFQLISIATGLVANDEVLESS